MLNTSVPRRPSPVRYAVRRLVGMTLALCALYIFTVGLVTVIAQWTVI